MADNRRWYFTKEQLENSPSIQCGYDKNKELSYRQQAANIIQDVGQKLKVNQLCINTAIVYMHRFFMFHSFTRFHRNGIATAALFLAAKVEEQPRSLEHIIQVSHLCMYRDRQPPLDTKSERYAQWVFDLIFIEDILLQTLGFDVAVDHPHTHIVHCCHMVKADKDLARTSYFMASNSLHLTTMCLQYKPTVVACVCIHIACKWSNREIPLSKEGKNWFWYIDRSITFEQLEQLTAEFLAIFDRCPTKLKHRLKGLNGTVSNTAHRMNGVPVPESQSLKASLLIEHSFSGLQCSSSASNHVAKAENSISATTAPSSTGIASQSVKPPKSISDIFDKSRKPESLPDKKLSTKYLNTGSDKVNCVSDIELVAHITSLQGQKKRDLSWLDDSTQLVPFSLNFKASQECFREDRHKPERSNKRQRQL